jgi:hypothetical protein
MVDLEPASNQDEGEHEGKAEPLPGQQRRVDPPSGVGSEMPDRGCGADEDARVDDTADVRADPDVVIKNDAPLGCRF